MAIELEKFITDQLARLPWDHPDRAFLRGVLKSSKDERRRRDIISQSQQEHLLDQGPLNKSITFLGLSARVKNRLLRVGFKNIDQLVAVTLLFEDGLAGMIGQLGKKSDEEITNKLDAFLEVARDDNPQEFRSSVESIEEFVSLIDDLPHGPSYWSRATDLYEIVRAGITTISQFNSLADDEILSRTRWPQFNTDVNYGQEFISKLRDKTVIPYRQPVPEKAIKEGFTWPAV